MTLRRNDARLGLKASLVALSVLTLGETARAADPTTADCLAASEASIRSGNEHKLRAERAELLVCAAVTCPEDIRKECLSRVDEVNPQIPTVVFAAKGPTGADLVAVKVTMDGELVTERIEGTALSLDPGEHSFTFETSGQPPVTRKLVIVEGQKDRREVITFGAAPSETKPAGPAASIAAPASAAPASPAPAPAAPPPPAPPAPEQSAGMGTQRILALVAGGIGVAGIGVGTAFGFVAMSRKSTAESACPSLCATTAGVSDWSRAASAGNVSTAGLIVGGVGLAGAAVLWFTAPSARATTTVGLAPGALLVRGSF